MNRWAPILWAAAGAVALAAPMVASERQEFVLMQIVIAAVYATSFNILLGYTGMVSFAHAAYFGIGTYTVALLWLHLDWPALAGLALAPLVSGVVALLSGVIALRAVRLYFALLTLALGQILFLVAFQWRPMTRGDDGIHGLVLPELIIPTTNRFYFLLAVSALCLGLMGILMHSPFGATLKAIRENRDRAAFLGIRVKRYELAAFTIGGGFSGAAGGMFAIFDQGSFPLLLHWTKSAEPIFITLIGGQFAFAGPAIGAAIFVPLREWITRNFDYWGAVLGVILLLIILFLPGGIAGGGRGLLNRRRPTAIEPEQPRDPVSVGGSPP